VKRGGGGGGEKGRERKGRVSWGGLMGDRDAMILLSTNNEGKKEERGWGHPEAKLAQLEFF